MQVFLYFLNVVIFLSSSYLSSFFPVLILSQSQPSFCHVFIFSCPHFFPVLVSLLSLSHTFNVYFQSLLICGFHHLLTLFHIGSSCSHSSFFLCPYTYLSLSVTSFRLFLVRIHSLAFPFPWPFPLPVLFPSMSLLCPFPKVSSPIPQSYSSSFPSPIARHYFLRPVSVYPVIISSLAFYVSCPCSYRFSSFSFLSFLRVFLSLFFSFQFHSKSPFILCLHLSPSLRYLALTSILI